MEWFRAYHGICSDTKWPLIARKANCSVGAVVSIWLALLECASQADMRGNIGSFDPEAVDALYGYEDGTTMAVVQVFAQKGLVKDGRIRTWEKHQPKRERDDDSAARVKQHREAKRHVTPELTEFIESNASVTPRNAQIREDKIREDKNINTSNPIRETVDLDRARSLKRPKGGEGN